MHDPAAARGPSVLPQSHLASQQQSAPPQPQYSGAVVPEKAVTQDSGGYLNYVGGYLADAGDVLSGYMPAALRKTLPSWSSSQAPPEDDRERPTWSGFDVLELANGERRNVLCVAYATGFQVWDIGDGQGDARELLSRREAYPIKCVRFLPQPAAREAAHHPFHGRRPMLVVLSNDENPTSPFANSMMKIYSVATGEYANMVKFSAEIHSVQATRRLVMVLLKGQLHAFDAVTMEQLFSFRTYPFASPLSAPSIACAALGPRFLAYASRDPPPPGAAAAPSASALKEAASSVASGLAYLGEAGRRRVAGLLYANNHPEPRSSPPDTDSPLAVESEAAGTVQVLDTVTRRVIAHFKAHTLPLSAMSWDPSGALLLTVSNEAHHFHVWIVTPAPAYTAANSSAPGAPQFATHTHLYKLVRGVTGAAVQSLSWSRDSRWLAVSSGRGTTHLFALHPQGGTPTTTSHASDAQAEAHGEHVAPGAPLTKAFATLNALARLKPQRHASAASSGAPNGSPLMGAGAGAAGGAWDEDEAVTLSGNKSAMPPPFPVGTALLPSGHVLLHGDGQMGKWAVQAHGPPPNAELDPRTLCVDLVPVSHWDLARRRAWLELKALTSQALAPLPPPLLPPATPPPVRAHPAAGPSESSATLWAEVELHTHAPPFRPLWAGPQFSLRPTDMAEFFAPISLLSPALPPSLSVAPSAAASAASSAATPSLPVIAVASPAAPGSLPPPPAPAAASLAPAVAASQDNAAGGGGGRRKDKKKNKAAAVVAPSVAASSPSPPAPYKEAGSTSPSTFRLDDPRDHPPLTFRLPDGVAGGGGPLHNSDLRSQSIMSAMSTPLMGPQSPAVPIASAPVSSSSPWSPGSSPLAPPIIEFMRPAQQRQQP